MTRTSPTRSQKNSRRFSILESALQPLEQRVLMSTVSIAAATANEGSPLQFTVSLDSPAASAFTVNYATSNKTAKSGVNYAGGKGTITFNPGDTSETLTINTMDDNVANAPLTMNVKLSKAPKGDKISPSSAVGTINNVDAEPVFTVSTPAPVAAFAKGTKTMTFTITETGRSDAKVSVGYSTQDLTAVAGTDYLTKSGTATFSGKKTTFNVQVKIKPQANLASDKDFLLQLSSPANATLGTPSYGVGVIGTTDTTSGSTLSADATDTGAAGSSATITVNLSQPAADPVTVNYATADGTATAGADYTATTGTLTFPVGVTTQTITVPILAGAAGAFDVNLSSPNNASVTAGTTAVTIQSSTTLPALTANSITVNESSSGSTIADFNVTLSAPASQNVTVNYATADDSAIAGTNYTATTGTLTIPAGATSGQIPVTILGGVSGSADFVLNLSGSTNATLTTPSVTATITNPNSALPSLSIADVSINQPTSGTANATFTVTLSAAASGTVTVNYATANGTAIAPTNYTAANGTLTFTAGQTTQQITVPIIGGVASSATFTVNLSSADNATISDATATGTIVNAQASEPTLSIGDVTQDEGTGANSTFDFPVTLSAASTSTVTVTYATADGTATGGALGSTNPNTDYYSTTGTLTFLPGTLTQDIDVTVIGDTTVEPNETFTVTLASPSNATLSRATATGTIVNDDTSQPTLPAIAVNDVSVAQVTGSTTTAAFLVSLTSAPSSNVTVNYATSDGTATAGTNYTATTGTLTFTPQQTSQVIDVPVLDDTSMTATSANFTLTLSSPSSNATLSTATATGTIYSNAGIQFDTPTNQSSGFAGNQNGINSFNYVIENTRASALPDAQIQFFLTAIGADLNNATPFQTSDLGSVAAGTTITGTVNLSSAPTLTAGMEYTARLISTTGTVTIVYDTRSEPYISI
ncbi:MAG TPA: Calx-beta domain-containing protein [Tepidisphaeraceae bacterium]